MSQTESNSRERKAYIIHKNTHMNLDRFYIEIENFSNLAWLSIRIFFICSATQYFLTIWYIWLDVVWFLKSVFLALLLFYYCWTIALEFSTPCKCNHTVTLLWSWDNTRLATFRLYITVFFFIFFLVNFIVARNISTTLNESWKMVSKPIQLTIGTK